MKRICLLYPPRPGGTGSNLVPPIGLLSLGAVLENAGFHVTLVDAALTGHSGETLLDDVIGAEPDILMISAFTSDVFILKSEITRMRRTLPDIPFFLGGPHSSSVGVAAFDDFPEVDAVFLGESEETIIEVLESPNSLPAKGVIFRGDIHPAEPAFIQDLSTLPVPAWHLAPPDLYRGLPNGVVLKKLPYAPIITSRGCPYLCTFCAGFRVTGRRIRRRPLEHVWKEIELLVNDFGVREIHIEDDNFTLDRNYAKEFCREAIERNLPTLFSTPNGIRLDSLDDELLDLMKEAGWYVIHCGIESGSDEILKRTKKATTTTKIQEKIDLIHRHGLPVAGYFILGIPGETCADIEKTILFAVDSGIEWAQFASFLPIPGSEDGDNYLKDHDLASDGWKAFHNTECPAPPAGITQAHLNKLQKRAFLRFYLRPAQLFRTAGLLFHRGTFRRLLSRFTAYLSTSKNS